MWSDANRISAVTEVTAPHGGSMAFTLTDEQRELARAVAAVLDKNAPETEVRRLMESGAPDPAVWSRMARQLDLPGLTVPEEYAGGGFVDFALVAESVCCSVCPIIEVI